MTSMSGRYILGGKSAKEWADYGRWFALIQLCARTPEGYIDVSDERRMKSLALDLSMTPANCKKWLGVLVDSGALDRESYESRGWVLIVDVYNAVQSYHIQVRANKRNGAMKGKAKSKRTAKRNESDSLSEIEAVPYRVNEAQPSIREEKSSKEKDNVVGKWEFSTMTKTDRRMNAHDLFEGCWTLQLHVNRLESAIESAYSIAIPHGQGTAGGSGHGGNHDPLAGVDWLVDADAVAELEHTKALLLARMDYATDVLYGRSGRGGVSRAIGFNEADMLCFHYLQGMSWANIAKLFEVEDRHPARWCQRWAERTLRRMDRYGLDRLADS